MIRKTIETKIYNINDSIQLIYRNNIKQEILDCIDHYYGNLEWYEKILEEVLKIYPKPKRVVDIGSNLNQYGYLFANEGIEYIGIDKETKHFANPIETNMIKFIDADYSDVKNQFKNDVIISCLCVGYLVDINNVKAKHLIINELDNRKAIAKKVW